jgi:hypothetical protein
MLNMKVINRNYLLWYYGDFRPSHKIYIIIFILIIEHLMSNELPVLYNKG